MIAPVDPMTERQARITRAITFLKSQCVLVDPVDRMAQVRRYRVSGKRDPMMAEQVIEYADRMALRMPEGRA
ncbi:MAG: hypothetical protein ACK5NN_00360 [Sphingomonadaceae bacterium]